MPHYADGTEAKVGDQVIGKLYNTPGIRAGTIISISPGADSCNAMVGFLVPTPHIDGVGDGFVPSGESDLARMAVRENPDSRGIPAARFRVMRPEHHGSLGQPYKLVECADYCAINELTKVGP